MSMIPTLRLVSLIAALLLGHAVPVDAAEMDLPTDKRIRVLTYTPSDVYTIPTKYGYQTSIVFAPGETIATVSVGDRSMWQIVPAGNRIFLRPMDDGLATNMTVITSQREYNFDILSVDDAKSNHLYAVQFRYPKPTDDEPEDAGDFVSQLEPPARGRVASPPLDTQRSENLNTAYSYAGDDAIAPVRVYDDGRRTYVLYSSMPSPAPVPTIMGDGGSRVVANHTINGNRMIVYLVADQLILASPSGEVTVYNEYSTAQVK